MSAVVHEDFTAKQTLYGTEEALREVKIQRHTVDQILKVVKDAKQDVELDLVSGDRVTLFFTDEEYATAKADYAAAEKAGVDVRSVEWLGREEVQAVSRLVAKQPFDLS